MRYILLFVLSSFLMAAQEKINQYDTNGKRHGLWKGVHEQSKRPRYEGTFEHGKEIGVFKYFDDTKAGTVIATRDFSKGNGSCYVIFYNQKSNKVSEGLLKNKLPEGEWKYYHLDSPQLMTTEFYRNGKLEGERKVFYRDGSVAEISHYKKGLLDGNYKKYGENEKLLEDINYKNGQLHGNVAYYDGNGHLEFKGTYNNGRKVGYWETYEEGKLVKKEKVTHYTRKTFKMDNPGELETKNDKK